MVGPKSNDKCPYKRHTGREKVKAEIRVVQPQTKELLDAAEAGGGKGGSHPRAFRMYAA